MKERGDGGFNRERRFSEEGPHHTKKPNIVTNRMKEILFAIAVTVVAAFAVKGIEMVVTNARESLTSTELVYAG